MSKFKKKKDGGLPPVNTASLPDIVFMLLFFFMVATVMRESTSGVTIKVTQADQVVKLKKKKLVSYIYAGKPSAQYIKTYGTEARMQLNDKFADVTEIRNFIYTERATRLEEEVPYMITALKVDVDTNMELVNDIKKELRDVQALKLNYATRKGDATKN